MHENVLENKKILEWLPTFKSCSCKPNAIGCSTHKEWAHAQWGMWNFAGKVQPFNKRRREMHPATFPIELPNRVISVFSHKNETVLDPFCGSGTTNLAAKLLGRNSVGFDISEEYCEIARKRLFQETLMSETTKHEIICDDSAKCSAYLPENSINLIITSPPYWNILSQKKTLIGGRSDKSFAKEQRVYTNSKEDLGNAEDYQSFLDKLKKIAEECYYALKHSGYFMMDVMDINMQDKFLHLSGDVCNIFGKIGYSLEGHIIWDRELEYQRAIFGWPCTFRFLKTFEHLILHRKI